MMDNEVLERTLREIKRLNEIIDEDVIVNLAECIETINERLKRIENRGLPDGVRIAGTEEP